MKLVRLLLISTLTLALCAGMAQAEIMSVDFDSMSTSGQTTEALLDSATTGGTWSLNTTRGNESYTIAADDSGNGNLAFLSDDTSTNRTFETFATIDLDTAVTLSSLGTGETLDMTFQAATRRSGNNKELQYLLGDSSGTVGLEIAWNNDGNEVFLNGTSFATGVSFSNVNPWDSTAATVFDVQISIHGDGDITGSFAGNAFPAGAALTGGIADIDQFVFASADKSNSAKGGYLNDISMEVVPEPSMLVPLAAAFVLGIRHRCRLYAR